MDEKVCPRCKRTGGSKDDGYHIPCFLLDANDRLVAENELLWAAFNAAEKLFVSLAPKDAPIKVPTQTLIDINNLGHAIVAVREHTRVQPK